MQHSVIQKAWFDYCTNVLPPEWTVTFAEELSGSNGARPPKPYLTLKIISGPRKIAMDDNLIVRNDAFELVGQRGYTMSVKAFGQDYIDILEDLSTCLDIADNWEQLKEDADIAIVDRGDVLDISAKLETGFERRASLDIIFNSSNNKVTTLEAIENIEIGGTMNSGTKEINTNMPTITKE